jgi:membrane-associated protease RseP (regulator of RpoE activity)
MNDDLAPSRSRAHGPNPLVNVGLFLATFFTTTATGAAAAHGADGAWFPLTDGLSFSVPLLTILLCHEFGHYFAARAHGVPASLPFFIPLPPGVGLLGTMGAVILQGGTTDRRKLIDIGAAGPLAGLVVAIPVLAWGLAQSEVGPIPPVSMQEGNSLLYFALKAAVKGAWLPGDGQDVFLHPTALAGWGGLLVTMLNLIPIGQLDGGHVATAYFGNRYERVAARLHGLLPFLTAAVFVWVYLVVDRERGGRPLPDGWSAGVLAGTAALVWVVWFFMLFVMRRMAGGRYHPPVDDRPLPPSRVALFWVVAVTFVLTFMPVPFRFSLGGAPDPGRPAPAVERAP